MKVFKNSAGTHVLEDGVCSLNISESYDNLDLLFGFDLSLTNRKTFGRTVNVSMPNELPN